jgi:SAM-dependent methyltransferase
MQGSGTPLIRPEFPRAGRYDAAWMMDNQMGPNAVWLVEWLAEALDLRPGMRVLDLGCGRALTSIFLARELGVRVHAADLWIGPDANLRRVQDARLEDLVCPVRAEAHALPFAAGYFDAVVSVDAYQYFGTDVLYLSYLARFVRPGGQLGVVVPGLVRELPDGPPPELTTPQPNGKVFWEPECRSFRTPAFWAELWRGCPQVEEVRTELMPDGWRHWRDFERALEQAGKLTFPSDADALDADQGRTVGFVRATARRTLAEAPDLYDPSLGAKVGVDR